MLALPGTRKMIEIKSLNQRGSSKNPFCPKFAAAYKCINKKQMIYIALNLTIKNQVQSIQNKSSND
jgi:hypothetical protein